MKKNLNIFGTFFMKYRILSNEYCEQGVIKKIKMTLEYFVTKL